MMKALLFVCRFGWIPIVVLGFLGVFLSFSPKCREYERLQYTKRSLEQENVRLESNIRQLETKRKRFLYDKEFVERTSREMGMVKPGETVYKSKPGDEP